MTSPEGHTREALSALVGLPLRWAGRALNMEMFAFGAKQLIVSGNGDLRAVHEFNLHIECPWRIVGPDGILVGCEDRFYPADETADLDTFDDDRDPALLEARLNTWLMRHAQAPLTVESVQADAVGGFKLLLSGGYVIEAFPADSVASEVQDHWLLFRPNL